MGIHQRCLLGNSISRSTSRECRVVLYRISCIEDPLSWFDCHSDGEKIATALINRDDMYAPDSIELLKNSGIDFKRNEEEGIDVEYFGELLVTSGLVLFDHVKWVSFHS
jgi:hypothetical protein